MNGEGFAYFRWHYGVWGELDCACPLKRCPVCVENWKRQQGEAP